MLRAIQLEVLLVQFLLRRQGCTQLFRQFCVPARALWLTQQVYPSRTIWLSTQLIPLELVQTLLRRQAIGDRPSFVVGA